MMVFIKGTVLHRGSGYVIIDHQGLGYKISCTDSMAASLDGEVELYLHEAVRDDGRELFAFESVEQLELFWKLIGVSGVGPRGAQKIVFSDKIEHVKAKIMAGDLAFLTSVPGVGKKTAQKIFLELKGALAEEPDVAVLDTDAVDALVGLGYTRRDAEAVLSGLEAEDTEARIRLALKLLSR